MKAALDRFNEENEKKLNHVVEKALADTDFKKKLMANPAGTFFETGCGMFRCIHCQQIRWIVGLDNYTIVK